jgi:hypothetical protein
VFSTIYSVAKLPRVVARTPLTSGRTCGTSCRMSRPLANACVWRFMWTPLMRTQFRTLRARSRRDAVCSVIAAFVLLVGASVADDAVPAGLCVCVRFGARASLSVCSRAATCVSCCWALPPSVPPPLGVLRPKPRWGRAWSPIWFSFLL